MSKEYPWGKGTPKWVRDATLNDSDKSFTVPAGKIWDMRSIDGLILATAAVGNRVLIITITDGTDVLWVSNYTGSIAASQYGFISANVAQGSTTTNLVPPWNNPTLNVNVAVQSPLPNHILPAGYVIRVYDRAAIDAAADDLTVVLHYVEYDA